MVITIGSPDKLSIAMFLSFLIRNLGRGYAVGEMHSLMSEESAGKYVDSMLKVNSSTVFTYYAKRILTPDCLPERLIWVSDAVVWFNMYETGYKLVKDAINFDALFKDTWEKNLKQLDGR